MILPQITLCLTVLVVENYSIISWTREILHRTKRQAECKPSPSPPEGGCLLPRPLEFGAYTSPVCQFDKKTAACRQIPGTPVPQNWLLSFKCNEGYYLKETQDANISVLCVDGKWSPKIPVCRTCGRRNWKGVNTPLITHGSAAKHGKFPWHVGVYVRTSSNQWDQLYGGSLISPHIVLTAAHCVSSWKGRPYDPETIKVGLGKYYREWTHDEPYAVQADVREVLVPPGFSGYRSTLNIALLDLTHSVQLHAGIMPVCVDWKREFTITPGELGTLAGWGFTERYYNPSDVLLSVDLPYVDHSHCIHQVPEEYQRWLTSDKFCAGYFKGTRAGYRDEGGGLTFVQDDLYYVYGIASGFILYGNSSITTFTNITNEEILNWLISSKNKLDKEHDVEYPEKETEFKCTSGQCIDKLSLCDGRVDCPDGSDETRYQCTSVSCPQWKFKCAYGACIGVNKTCNGQADCADGSDEADCPIATTTTRLPPPSTTSPSPNLPTQPPGPPIYGGGYGWGGGLGATSSHAFPGTPIPVSFRCKETEFKCTSGQCIDKLSLCDGRVDCPDGSDETRYQCASVSIVQILTQTISFSCPKSKFPCSYGACIDANKQCDGQSDCADGSDEEVSACPGRTKTSVLALAAPTHIVRTSVPASATPTHILRTNDVQNLNLMMRIYSRNASF